MIIRIALFMAASVAALHSQAQEGSGPKDPVVLPLSVAKLTPGMKRFGAAGIEGSFVTRWMSSKETIDYVLNVEPGRYRLTATYIPDGGGYLLAKIGEGTPVRRSIPKLKGPWKPQEMKMGEIEVPARGAVLRFLPDNAVAPGLCLFLQAELEWVGHLPEKSQVKSPTEIRAEKDKAAKAVADALAGAKLIATLKGTSWNWFASSDFSGQAFPMSFNPDGTMRLPWNGSTRLKGVDAKTIDAYYSETSFWRLRFSDDLKSFRSDLSVGMREPKSGQRN
ncbi:MAG: hypothetical protein RI969_321 [Verrucomicrobiota bacterium]|jgi:hypothetical protein